MTLHSPKNRGSYKESYFFAKKTVYIMKKKWLLHTKVYERVMREDKEMAKKVIIGMVIVVMTAVIALGAIEALKYTCWNMAQTYGSYYLEDRGVVAESNYVDNKLMVEMHHRNGDRPIATVYDIKPQGILENMVMNGRTIDIYDDGAIEVVSL